MIPPSEQIVLLLGGSLGSSSEQLPPEEKDFDIASDDELDVRIEEAILALTRAVFSRGWRLEFRHDPVVTPLALEVALDYWQALPGEESGRENRRFTGTPLLIFGTELDQDDREAIDYAMHIGCATFLPEADLNFQAVSRVVCVGGTADVEKYVGALQNRIPKVPIFTIPSTGGAAEALANLSSVANLERSIVEEIVSRRAEMKFEPPTQRKGSDSRNFTDTPFEQEPIPQFRYALYPLLMNEILESESGAPFFVAR